jgi:hypothetical protein
MDITEKKLVSNNSGELVQALGERYGIGKTQVYEYRKHLGIKFGKEEGQIFITTEQLSAFDDLNEWVNSGNKLEEWTGSFGELAVSESGNLAESWEHIEENPQPLRVSRGG